MKKISFLISTVVFLFISIHSAQAQSYRTDSNTINTTVGEASGGGGGGAGEFSCPIPGGTITCGSKAVPINGCGHCGLGYESYMGYCTYPGINYAMDIAGGDFTPVILPSVNGAIIDWTFAGENGKTSNEAIQYYSGTDPKTGDKYWIQFHHTAPGSGKGSHSSGDVGASICGSGCGKGHVHVEFAKVTPSGNQWQDAPNYFCKK